jgi:hypothetical protein
MPTENLIEVLIGALGALAMIIWTMVSYEIRKLREVVHETRNAVYAVNTIVSILAKKQGLDWSNPAIKERS